ncbi:MAG TPA: hypothetical protein VF344_04320 [Candidatus Limnocylindrales bacterium]
MNNKFEIEVSEMLIEHAKVDRSTVELTRASIGSLPDRKPSRTARFGFHLPGLPIRRGSALALVGVGALVVAVVAVSLFGRIQSSPVAPGSPTPSSVTPLVTATPSPSDVPSPSIAPDTLSTRRPTAAFQETLPVVYTGNALSAAGWSPDGSHFAIAEFTIDSGSVYTGMGVIRNPTIHIFDSAGVELESRGGLDFAWLDASSYVIVRDESVGGVGSWRTYIGRVGSTQLTALGNYDSIVAGPSGAVALRMPWDQTLANPPQYVLVSGGSVSEPRDGYPAAWSRDGSLLAVFHPTQEAVASGSSGPTGWLEVVRSTGQHVVSADKIATGVTGQVAFSPDGARLAFRDETNPTAALPHLGVLDVPSGRLTSIPRLGTFTWASSSNLLFVEDNSVISWLASTGKVSTYGPGDLAAASGRGVVVLGNDATHTLTWTNTAPGAPGKGSISLASGPSFGIPDAVAWSPDGKSLLVIVGDPISSQYMDAVIAHF